MCGITLETKLAIYRTVGIESLLCGCDIMELLQSTRQEFESVSYSLSASSWALNW